MSTKHKIAAYTVVAAMTALIFALPGKAAEVNFQNVAYADVSAKTSIPIGHAEFCKRNAEECVANATMVATEALTESRWAELVNVNNQMNASIVPVTDEDLYGVGELWVYPDNGYGDCEDIALAKRRALISLGWAPSALLMTVVKEANGDGHAVLMVRTDRGDLILDNQEGMVRVWTETPYQFIKRQSQANAADWVSILDQRLIVAQN
jgi:predicted transglutaminase-like cysteine proteinase